jgi:hypothetical protein
VREQFWREKAADEAREAASIARGEKRARLKIDLRAVLFGLMWLRTRALDDIDNIALTLGEGQ